MQHALIRSSAFGQCINIYINKNGINYSTSNGGDSSSCNTNNTSITNYIINSNINGSSNGSNNSSSDTVHRCYAQTPDNNKAHNVQILYAAFSLDMGNFHHLEHQPQ